MNFFSNPLLVADVKKEERDNEDGYKAKRRKETAIQDTKKISPVGKKMAEKMSDQKAVYPSEEDRIVIEIGSSEDEDERSDDEPCASGQNVAASGYTEVKQEEENGSAAKKPTLDTVEEPGTSRVSSSSETRKFKVRKGNPELDELEQLANDIDPSVWKKVARKLKIDNPVITAIDKENEEFYEKKYTMLQKWKQANGSAATWRELNQALMDANLRELAEKHCCVKMN